MRRRGHVIPLRLNEREYRYLCEQVEMSGLPREEYLRTLIAGKAIHARPCRWQGCATMQISLPTVPTVPEQQGRGVWMK